jgi:hypothetical protein
MFGGTGTLSYQVFENSIASDSLKRVARFWQAARGRQLMPGWDDLKLSEIDRLIPILWSYIYEPAEERFVGRVAGANIEQIFGKGFAGTPMKELYPPKDYPRLYARARRVIDASELYRGTGTVFSHLDHSGSGERIMLPLAADGTHADGVLGATVYQFFLGERVEPEPESDHWFAL